MEWDSEINSGLYNKTNQGDYFGSRFFYAHFSEVRMNGITEFAKLFKERENGDGYSPMFGTVIELPNTKIRISDKVILTDSHITLCINLKEQNADGEYINLGKTVVLLPYANGQKFIVIGVVI